MARLASGFADEDDPMIRAVIKDKLTRQARARDAWGEELS
jgi:hypothetical protein